MNSTDVVERLGHQSLPAFQFLLKIKRLLVVSDCLFILVEVVEENPAQDVQGESKAPPVIDEFSDLDRAQKIIACLCSLPLRVVNSSDFVKRKRQVFLIVQFCKKIEGLVVLGERCFS